MLSVLSLGPSYTLPSAGAPSSARRTPVSRMAADGAPKIVVTGLGVVSALGSGDEFWEKITAGECGIDEVTGFDASRFPTTIGAECKDFDPAPWFDNKKSVKSTDRYTHLAMAASKMAVADSAIDLEKTDSWRFGCIIGSAFGGMDTFEKQALALDKGKKVSPFMVPAILGNTAAGMVGIELGPQGPNFGVASACAAGSHAIGEAVRHMKEGAADVMLCGGAEAAMTPLSYAGFCAMKAMNSKFNDSPKKASRPFDADRAGFVMGEGAGVLLLETEEHAKVRARAFGSNIGGGARPSRATAPISHTPRLPTHRRAARRSTANSRGTPRRVTPTTSRRLTPRAPGSRPASRTPSTPPASRRRTSSTSTPTARRRRTTTNSRRWRSRRCSASTRTSWRCRRPSR